MNKKEKSILEELFKNNPDLDKKKLEKIIELLRKNNPEINIDKDFKQTLKSRLASIIEYNQITKKSFFGRLFLVPVFSMFLIIGWVFYIYKDMNLLEQNNIKYDNTELLNNKLLDYELEEIREVILEEDLVNKITESKIIKAEIIKKPKQEKIINIEKIELKTKKNIGIVDNQVMEILWENNISNNTEDLRSVVPEAPASTMFYDNWISEPYINSFEDYCEEYSSELLINESWDKYCIIEEKICMESNYINNTCKLIQKK